MPLELVLQPEPLGVAFVLAAAVRVERAPQADDLVGEQPRPRVANHCRDRRGLAGDLGLPAERLQLATDLAGEVGESREVGLHRIELAQRLLFAPPVLEDARGLLDEAATIFGGGAQHLVELALPDDDVHLAPEARVAAAAPARRAGGTARR